MVVAAIVGVVVGDGVMDVVVDDAVDDAVDVAVAEYSIQLFNVFWLGNAIVILVHITCCLKLNLKFSDVMTLCQLVNDQNEVICSMRMSMSVIVAKGVYYLDMGSKAALITCSILSSMIILILYMSDLCKGADYFNSLMQWAQYLPFMLMLNFQLIIYGLPLAIIVQAIQFFTTYQSPFPWYNLITFHKHKHPQTQQT